MVLLLSVERSPSVMGGGTEQHRTTNESRRNKAARYLVHSYSMGHAIIAGLDVFLDAFSQLHLISAVNAAEE